MTRTVKTEKVFCGACVSVTDCTVRQTMDYWIWTCTVCGSEADRDLISYDPRDDGEG